MLRAELVGSAPMSCVSSALIAALSGVMHSIFGKGISIGFGHMEHFGCLLVFMRHLVVQPSGRAASLKGSQLPQTQSHGFLFCAGIG